MSCHLEGVGIEKMVRVGNGTYRAQYLQPTAQFFFGQNRPQPIKIIFANKTVGIHIRNAISFLFFACFSWVTFPLFGPLQGSVLEGHLESPLWWICNTQNVLFALSEPKTLFGAQETDCGSTFVRS
jgi:hypothetical protein